MEVELLYYNSCLMSSRVQNSNPVFLCSAREKGAGRTVTCTCASPLVRARARGTAAGRRSPGNTRPGRAVLKDAWLVNRLREGRSCPATPHNEHLRMLVDGDGSVQCLGELQEARLPRIVAGAYGGLQTGPGGGVAVLVCHMLTRITLVRPLIGAPARGCGRSGQTQQQECVGTQARGQNTVAAEWAVELRLAAEVGVELGATESSFPAPPPNTTWRLEGAHFRHEVQRGACSGEPYNRFAGTCCWNGHACSTCMLLPMDRIWLVGC